MKKSIAVLLLLAGISYASAGTCVDLTKNVSRYQENSSVLSLQNFLFEKGYLKATPNGYYGAGTFAAVKAYQKSLGLEQVGNVGPGTRAAIKKASCGSTASQTLTTPGTASSSSQKPTAPTISSALAAVESSTQQLRNVKRRADVNLLLQALYQRFSDTRGAHPVSISDTPLELCVTPPAVVTIASTTDSAVVVTQDSPCLKYADITSLSPSYLTTIPRDPSLSPTSVLTGYTILRNEYNDITIAAKTTDNSAIIKVQCNFSAYCKDVKNISTVTYSRPEITTIDRSMFIRDAVPKTPIIIKGKNFTTKNKIKLYSLYNSKEYYMGEYTSTVINASSSSISFDGALINQGVSCGNGCVQKLPLGDYMLSVVNEGGESGSIRLVLQGFTTSTISARANSSIIPATKNVKVASITVSSSIPVKLQSLTLTSSSTSSNLSGRISNFVMKDTSSSAVYTGPGFSFGGVSLYENQSKIYDIYVDVAEVYNPDAGFITYGGKLLVTDTFNNVDVEVPIKEFSFTVSH